MEGRKVFDEVRQANPAIWRQYENVTVVAPQDEIISKVVITDMRPEKDGDVQIINGGAMQKSVTIELKSPTVLRGYEFRIEVYSVPDTVATDAEEHLSPDSAPVPNDSTSEQPNDTANKDIQDSPIAVGGDINSEVPRSPRESEENQSQTDIIKEDTTTISYETSSIAEDEPVTMDETTVLPETPEVPALELDSDNNRPARETVLNTAINVSDPPVTDSDESEENEASTEGSGTTSVTEPTGSAMTDATATEAVVTTASYEHSTYTPISYDNTKNVPDYASLNILDYIKNREAIRPIRRTEDNASEPEESSEPPIEPDVNTATTPLVEETSSVNLGDDTVGLVPPKIDASYNTDFADSETTEHAVESSTLNDVVRAGRDIDFDSDVTETSTINTEEESTLTSTTSDVTTPTPTISDVTTATQDEDHTASIDDQLRNTRGARHDHDGTDVNVSEEGASPSSEGLPGVVDLQQPNKNVIIINLDEIMARDENNRFTYALPIVLLINSESNYPIIKIIAESNDGNESKVLYPIQPSDISMEPSEYDYKSMENDRIKGDLIPTGDYDSQ
ncbi:mucin-17-like [Bicyclus anynana]|uniref:Mucin-17-like n=1 Tax=Bicyclus anynana TaxID=110368 RepID=A0A6J1N159_BICAN|nr:mucin-17-like [Bicyclus anynana]